MAEPDKFKNAVGRYFLRELFFETTNSDKTNVVYTLKEKDHVVGDKTYPSLYRLYLDSNDPTEHSFATSYLGGWSHWKELLECSWFIEKVSQWREELEVRMKSQSLKRIMTEAKTGSRESFLANKYLLEKGWVPKETNTKGRPSKEEIKKKTLELINEEASMKNDAARLGVQIN